LTVDIFKSISDGICPGDSFPSEFFIRVNEVSEVLGRIDADLSPSFSVIDLSTFLIFSKDDEIVLQLVYDEHLDRFKDDYLVITRDQLDNWHVELLKLKDLYPGVIA